MRSSRSALLVAALVALILAGSASPALAGRGSAGRGSSPRPSTTRPSTTRPSTPRPSTPRPSTPRPSTPRTTVNRSSTTVIHNHVYAPRVYGGHTFVYSPGGWGYGFYGPHPVFSSWYGYPLYYGNPGHWSGWDWLWFPLGVLAVLALLGAVVVIL